MKTKQKIESEYKATKVLVYIADITDVTALEQSISTHAKIHGNFDVLVANAGYLPSNQSLLESSSQDWFKGFEVNVKGNFNLVRAFMPYAVPAAVVLSITSAVAHLPYIPGMSSYAASKLAAGKVFEYLHHEHSDLFVLNIHPGMIKTSMSDKALNGVAAPVPCDDSKLDCNEVADFALALITCLSQSIFRLRSWCGPRPKKQNS